MVNRYWFALRISLSLLFLSASPSLRAAEAQACGKQSLQLSSAPAAYGQVAPDFQVNTTRGPFSLQQAWDGCDVFVVFKTFTVAPTHPLKGLSDQTNLMWQSGFEYLLQYSPRNAQYIFVSQNNSESQRSSDLALIQTNFARALAALAPAEQAYWSARIHFVTDDTTALGSAWIGGIGVESFVIDRSQLVRAIGVGAYSPLLQNGDFLKLAMEAQYSNFLSLRDAELKAKSDVVLVKAFENESVQAGWAAYGGTIKEVRFPTAEAMKNVSRLSIDLELSCDQRACVYENGQYYYDRLVEVYLCKDEADTECDIEVGRWITPFGLGGRWVHDISPLLALFEKGGSHRLRFHTVDKYKVNLNFRLESNPTEAPRPFAYEEVYRGGKLDAAFNQREPKAFAPPPGTRKVELVTITTGHGWGRDQENCAEFCVTEHEWVVNGQTKFVNTFTDAANQFACFLSTSIGVVPNQPGTWYFGRGGWCPGLEVKPVVWDITPHIEAGGSNSLSYRALFKGQDYVPIENPNGQELGYAPEINLRSYLVYSR